MLRRLSWLLLVTVSLLATAGAKDKSKASLPDIVLQAQTVVVVIDPEAGEPLDHPTANATARDNAEKALMQWGRLHLVMEGQEADLVITVRTGSGRSGEPTVKGGPIDRRPAVIQSTDTDIRIGAHQGQPPSNDPSANPNMPGQDNRPHISNEVGSAQDSLAVYLVHIQSPLDSSPIWRYTAKDCLSAPAVNAVDQFRKAIAESEKRQQKKP